MKAILIKATGGPEAMEEVHDAPRPQCGDTDVIVRNEYAGVNYIDTYHRTGLYPLPLPLILGREGAGVVDQVGSKVASGIKVGDKVTYLSPHSYAEYTAVPERLLAKLPAWIDTRAGAASLLQGLTACGLTHFAYPVKAGDTVLVHAAAGGTGRLLVQICHRLGARVIATVSTQEKAEIARSLGADEVILYSTEDVVERVKQLTDGKGVHCVYDGVGASTFDASLASLRTRGVLVSFGNASGKVPPFDIARLSKGNTSILRPTLFEYVQTREDFDQLCKTLFDMMNPASSTSHKPLNIDVYKAYPLTAAGTQEAHRDLESRKTTGKLILTVSAK
ncbi:hypothetical protein RI367_002602 [Sorochytrium milnesiophthora]